MDWFNIFGTVTVFVSLEFIEYVSPKFRKGAWSIVQTSCITLRKDSKKSISLYWGYYPSPSTGMVEGAFIYEINMSVGTGWEKNRKKNMGFMGETSWDIWWECNFWSMVRAVLEKKHLYLFLKIIFRGPQQFYSLIGLRTSRFIIRN